METTARELRAGRRKWPRLIAVLVPALAFLGVLGAVLVQRTSLPRPGDPAPDFRAPLLGGEGSLALSDLAGKPVMINFWASWCVPCVDEAPLLREAHEAYGDEVAFVGVDIRDARSDALAFVERHRLRYPSVRDERREISDAYGLTGQPESFFVDADGIIVEHVPGPLDAQGLRTLLDVLVSRDG